MLNKAIADKLNEQINLEFYSSNVLFTNEFFGVANTVMKVLQHFLLRHADEELEHMQKLFKYVSETSGMPLLGKIDAPKKTTNHLKKCLKPHLNTKNSLLLKLMN